MGGGASDCAPSGTVKQTLTTLAVNRTPRTDIPPPCLEKTGRITSSRATRRAEERRALRVHVQIQHLRHVGLLEQHLLPRDERRNALAEQISHGVNAIQRRGALVKDLDRGLLDFYALMGDRLIFLCWQAGETEVKHWHSLEGGFSTRQPINHSELE
jgi:hypothetical protein